MDNLNNWGNKHLWLYLEHYYMGLTSFADVCRYVNCCFDKRD